MPSILQETNDFVVIEKPHGLLTHGVFGSNAPSVAGWFAETYPDSKDVGEPLVTSRGTVTRPGVVHRLDKDTSGVMVLAKTDAAYQNLKKQFGKREVRKEYLAVVSGVIEQVQGSIRVPIGRDPKLASKRRTGSSALPPLRDATTHFITHGNDGHMTVVRLRPITGRMHQIRVHLGHIAHPVVGDTLYSGKRFVPADRLMLHAVSLEFADPTTGERVKISQNPSGSMKELIDRVAQVL